MPLITFPNTTCLPSNLYNTSPVQIVIQKNTIVIQRQSSVYINIWYCIRERQINQNTPKSCQIDQEYHYVVYNSVFHASIPTKRLVIYWWDRYSGSVFEKLWALATDPCTYQLVFTVVMKNWEPLVFDPAFAMDKTPIIIINRIIRTLSIIHYAFKISTTMKSIKCGCT